MPLLRDEQGTSRAVAGLHGTALALGSLVSGTVTVPLVTRYSRRLALVGGAGVACLGIVLLVAGPGLGFTLAGALVAGVGGSVCINTVNPVLSVHHGSRSAAFISEGNAVAAGCGVVAPLALGAGVALGLTWRAAIALAVPLGLLTMALVWRAPRLPALSRPTRWPGPALEPGVNTADLTATRQRARATFRHGPAFWAAWSVVIACVATEFCVTFWAADLLRHDAGLSKGSASAAISVLLVGMTIGRVVGGPLTQRLSSVHLLQLAIGTGLVGWLLFWATGSAVAGILGLGVVGLGLAMQYPMALVRLIAATHGRPDTAVAWSSVGVGLASGIAPFALGALADRAGTREAFLLVPVLLAVAGVLVTVGPSPE